MLNLTCPCKTGPYKKAISFISRPLQETKFSFTEGVYERYYLKCDFCGHFISQHNYDLQQLYDYDYVTSTYGGSEGMKIKYKKIMNLPSSSSDNFHRVNRILQILNTSSKLTKGKLLDFGSGLGVFPSLMTSNNWQCVAIEPDDRTVEHLIQTVGLKDVYKKLDQLPNDALNSFDLITLNKVLEHVEDPQSVLDALVEYLSPTGCIYIEVPDAETVYRYAQPLEREEFFIEHLHGFTPSSLALLLHKSGLLLTQYQTIVEPSSKYTIWAVATK